MEVLIEKDARVDPFDPRHCKLLELADLSGFLAQVDFPENMWRKVRKGQRARIEIPALPEARFEGEVLNLDTQINANTGCFAARIKIEPAARSELLMAGMFAVVSLKEEEPVPEKTPP